jgi:teichuronopeptide biosynthesis TupA-like protein/tetratricopeptide repeat protein
MEDALVEAAYESFRAGDLAGATRRCREALHGNGRNLHAIFLLAVIHFRKEEFADTERLTARGLEIDPNSADLWYNRGAALLKLNRWTESVACFDRALSFNPNVAETWNYRGEALRQLGLHDEGLQSFARSIVLRADYAPSYMSRSLAYRALGRNEEALKDALHYESLVFAKLHDYAPEFRKPRSFSEKVVHRKLFVRDPAYSMLADKAAVRDYVLERASPEILNEVFCVVSDPDEIPFSHLPERFVVKPTHASGWNILVPSKVDADIESIKRTCHRFLRSKYGELSNERHYLDIRPQIMAEAFLSDANGNIPIDYKCYVFHGRCHYIGVHFDRFGRHTCRTFDRNWNPLDVTVHYPLGPIIEPPKNLSRMIEAAERIADGFDFLRVDLYSIDKRIVFGEVTVTPGAGYERFGPDAEFDFHLGSLW